MQNVKKLSRTAAVFLLAALILICSTVLPNTGTTVNAASAELTSIGLAEHALKAYRDGWQYSYGAYGNFNSNGVRASDCSGLIYSYFCWVDDNSNIQPNWNYPRTVTAQANDAVESGPIDTIPRTHGLIVTIANYDHVGVYVGNGMVVDNSTFRAMVGCNGTSSAALHTPRQAGISLTATISIMKTANMSSTPPAPSTV